jgi:YVTN family beta-propeller protein
MLNRWFSRFVVSVMFPAGVVCLGVNALGAELPASLLVVNQKDVNVSVIDPATGKQVATLPEKETAVHGHEVVVSPDGRTAYLPIYGSVGVGHAGLDGHTMLVFDVASRKITGELDFGHGIRPHDPVWDASTGMLYVTTELDKTVSIIDPKTLKIVGTIPTGQEQSHMLAVSHDGKWGYTANVGPGTVSVLDMKARKTVTVIPIAKTTQRIALSMDDKMAFTADQTKPQLAVIDTATNKVKDWIALPGIGYGTAATKDGKWLLVAVPAEKVVAVVDLKTLKVVRTVAVPGLPQEVLMRPDGKMAYVSCNVSGEVAAIDLGDWTMQELMAGKGADGLAWAK